MDIKHFKRLIKKVENLGEEIDFYGGNSTENIALVENKLQLKFNTDVKNYLQEFGGGGVIDLLFSNGIIPEDPLSDNMYTLLGATTEAREAYQISPKYLVIEADLPEKCWVLDTETNKIVSIDILDKLKTYVLYNSFNDYLIQQWQTFIEDN